jgi:hypothetical protein
VNFPSLPKPKMTLNVTPCYVCGETNTGDHWAWEKDDKWPPEQIIQYYGPATWAEDGPWGYHTPIYTLNCIIRLQAVVEVITNEIARALNLLAKQSTKMCNAIYQNCLALNYLLASEGGVCEKFNLSNCCLQIDDKGKVIKKSQTE